MLTIFICGFMNNESTFRREVFPVAVPPQTKKLKLCSTRNQKYERSFKSQVPNSIISTGVRGASVNILMVKLLPLLAMSVANVACILDPSGNVPSINGLATEMPFPQRSDNLFTK